jgi:hypothetical protein
MGLLAACSLVFSLVCLPVFAGTITGQIQTSTGGAVANGTLIFTLSQPAILARHRASDQPALWGRIHFRSF